MFDFLSKTLIFLLLTPNLALAAVYTWTDKKGVIHLEDKPRPQSTIIQEKQTNISHKKTFPQELSNNPAQSPQISIISPQNNETIHANDRKLSVNVNFPKVESPKIVLFLDNIKNTESNNGNFELTEIDRGEHSLKAQLYSKDKLIAESPQVIFFLWQKQIPQ